MTLLEETIDSIRVEIRRYVNSQPYSIRCLTCSRSLDHNSELDPDGDLNIDVEPCNCANKET
jgi:hypothetical protein